MLDSESKSRYRELCAAEPTIPIFSRDWWLDAVCDEFTWDVALAARGGAIVGALPYCARARWGRRLLGHPQLTQTLGPWLSPSIATSAKDLALQKDIMEELIRGLPPFGDFSQYWHYSRTNWLPFHWHGFSQTTAYTYVLSALGDREKLWAGLQKNIRSDINKATGRFGLRVRDDLTVADFLPLNRATFSRQSLPVPYSDALVHRVDAACASRNCRKILVAEDAEGRRHAGVYIVWDEVSAYYIMGAGDPALRNSGATSLCMWEAITQASGVTTRFDFEGSMIESIERFFRAFGAAQTPYFHITKTPSRLFRARRALAALRRP